MTRSPLPRILPLLLFCLVALSRSGAAQSAPQPRVSSTQAREAINAANQRWSTIRLTGDSVTARQMLTEDFFATIGTQRFTRDEFLSSVMASRGDQRLVRFDMKVLTVQPVGVDSWVALIEEKLEIERTAPDGTVAKNYAMWITKDTWRETDGVWRGASSEAVGMQQWFRGARPPMADW